jgi:DNA-directed RNA polymerase beta subunit
MASHNRRKFDRLRIDRSVRGVWMEIETDRRGIISCKIDRKRKIPITQLLRVFGYATDEAIMDLFKDVVKTDRDYILATLEKDPIRTVEEANKARITKITMKVSHANRRERPGSTGDKS